jgi:hypothetical protein
MTRIPEHLTSRAQEHPSVSDDTFYHGTSGQYSFQSGDYLTPEDAPRNVMGVKSGKVFYTSSLDAAKKYATPHYPDLDSDDYTPGHVYAVQPETRAGRKIGNHSVDPWETQAYKTRGRLRVLHEVDPDTGEPR